VRLNTLIGSNTRRVYSSGKIILPKNHFEYFKNKTLIPVYSKFKEGKYNILHLADPKNIEKRFHKDYVLITESRNLFLPKEALSYINNPKNVLFLGMLDKLEIWNSKDFKKYDKLHLDSLEELAKSLTSEELEKLHF
jgi:hypothetical protein